MKVIIKTVAGILLLFAFFTSTASASKSPAGYWVATSPFFYGQPVAVIKIYFDNSKKLCGQIVKILPLNKSIDRSRKLASSGPVMMCGFEEKGGKWLNGRIYEQITAKTYEGSITITADGNHLYVRGYKGPFYRTARWDRIR